MRYFLVVGDNDGLAVCLGGYPSLAAALVAAQPDRPAQHEWYEILELVPIGSTYELRPCLSMESFYLSSCSKDTVWFSQGPHGGMLSDDWLRQLMNGAA
jgi:hypothetical protein